MIQNPTKEKESELIALLQDDEVKKALINIINEEGDKGNLKGVIRPMSAELLEQVQSKFIDGFRMTRVERSACFTSRGK